VRASLLQSHVSTNRYNSADSEVHSGIQLLSLYHDSLLSPQTSPTKPFQSPHSRYTRFWTSTSSLYKQLALIVRVIQYTELLWEMAAKRRGEKVRWRVIVILEAIKAVCRLILLRLTSNRPVCSIMLPSREPETDQPKKVEEIEDEDDELIQLERAEELGETVAIRPLEKPKVKDTIWKMPRTGLTLPSLPSHGDISSYLMSRVLTADDIKPASALLHRLSTPLSQVAEVAYILRPLVYALALQRWKGNKRDWRPWLLGLGIEFCARQLAKREIMERTPGGWRGMSSLERDEFAKRGRALWWWSMRGAFWENFTKYVLLTRDMLTSQTMDSVLRAQVEEQAAFRHSCRRY
jgi:peroxin-16